MKNSKAEKVYNGRKVKLIKCFIGSSFVKAAHYSDDNLSLVFDKDGNLVLWSSIKD